MEIMTATDRFEFSQENRKTLEDVLAIFESNIQSYAERGEVDYSVHTTFSKEISDIYRGKGYKIVLGKDMKDNEGWVDVSWGEKSADG